MDNFGTTQTSKHFMKSLLKNFYKNSWFVNVTNRDFETPGDENPKSTKTIKSKNQTFTVTSIFSNGWSDYSGSDLTYTEALEAVSTLTINVFKKVNDKISSLSAFKSAVSDPDSGLIESQAEKLRVILQKAFLASVVDAGAGNWIGTPYNTGTVTVATSTGAVTGSGTTFTAAMVGRPFKALGHTKWYRVKTYTSATAIVIEDDLDDATSAYTGGAISAGATYEIQANTAVAITSANIAANLAMASQMLDDASFQDNDETTVPSEGRFLFLPAIAKSALLTASEFNRDIEMVYNNTVKKGVVAEAYGFDIYVVKTVWFKGIDGSTAGNNTTGYACPFGQKSWLTAGMGFIDPVAIITAAENQTNFGNLFKGLFGYGLKVADTRRHMGGLLFATFS